MGRKSKLSITGLLVVAAVAVLNETVLKPHTATDSGTKSVAVAVNGQIDYGTVSDEHPTNSLASSVLSDTVKTQLKTKTISFNGAGAFILNNNQTSLKANVSSQMYVSLAQVDNLGRPGVANALLTKSARQYQSRSDTGNDAKITPVGWHQLEIGGRYQYLYNRGHSIGYAIAGKVRGFDASEANQANISTQTAWANQASNGDNQNTGQNYYETLVRRALDQNKRVRYRVTPIYAGDNLVPAGTQLEAKSTDGALMFNVFVPNVQPGVAIDYASGVAKAVK
jgi:DNA-entry nuclease